MEEKDAVIVGARCAGATLALALAERGWDVLLVDRDTFPSDTVSTHTFFPNTVARFEQLGILDALQSAHRLSWLQWRVAGMGQEITGPFTPVDGFDRAASVRRISLDKIMVDTALAAGAQGRLGEKVVGLIGSGTPDDPVSGIVLENGDEVRARWVFGADGRGSTVAGQLGIEKERAQRGELAYLFGYWNGIPDDGYGTLRVETDGGISRWAVEDGLHLLVAAVDAEATRGTHEQRRQRYLAMLGRFPDTLPPSQLEAGEMISEIVVAPESLMRGFFRQPNGPGWALLGDAAHFKHPGTAQGIADAVEQAIYIAEHLSGPSPTLDGYVSWIDGRAAEHYDWSFAWGRFPKAGVSDKLFAGWAGDPAAGQELRDTFSRQANPSELMSKERMDRWFADAPARAGAG
jgi:2-polyprenyl-6-methoxyphenol hydroxylase-like FAD-dependent oxidoreductase